MKKVETIIALARQRLTIMPSDGLLIEAARLLSDPRHNLVAVCDGGGILVGVLSKTDIVSRISQCAGSSCTTSVDDVMTHDVYTCQPDHWLKDVWQVIKDNGLKNLPIVDEMRAPVGILSAKDTVQALLDDAQHEEELLIDYVACVGYR